MKNNDGILGLLKDIAILAGSVAVGSLIVKGVSNTAFERGKQGKRPIAYPERELQDVAQASYKAGQMANITESAKKVANK